MALLQDIGIDPNGQLPCALLYHMRASQMGVLSKEEFEFGMKDLGVDSIDGLKGKVS